MSHQFIYKMEYYILELTTTKYIIFDNLFGFDAEGSTPVGSLSPRQTVGVLTKGNKQKLILEINDIQKKDKKAEFFYMKKIGKLLRCSPGLPTSILYFTDEYKNRKK